MDYRIEKAGNGKCVAVFSGRLTFVDANTFHEVTDAIRQSEHAQWAFDFSALEFIDSAGLGMLLMARDVVSDLGKRLVVHHAQGQVHKALTLARFQDLIQIEE